MATRSSEKCWVEPLRQYFQHFRDDAALERSRGFISGSFGMNTLPERRKIALTMIHELLQVDFSAIS